MQQLLRHQIRHHFARRWISWILIMSVLEAIGLAIQFNVTLLDPELASMEPLYMDTQGASAATVCVPCTAAGSFPRHAASGSGYRNQDRFSRRSETR
jgi:hypothetical protein